MAIGAVRQTPTTLEEIRFVLFGGAAYEAFQREQGKFSQEP